MIRYEIGPITDRFRNGHFTLLIDGMDTEYTCDPAQFAPTGLRLGLEQGLSHADAAIALRPAADIDGVVCDVRRLRA